MRTRRTLLTTKMQIVTADYNKINNNKFPPSSYTGVIFGTPVKEGFLLALCSTHKNIIIIIFKKEKLMTAKDSVFWNGSGTSHSLSVDNRIKQVL